MRRALLVVLIFARVAAADSSHDRDPPAVAAGVQILRASDASWRFQVVSAPALAPQLGAQAVGALDVAAGRATAFPDVLGDEAPAPKAWPYDVEQAQSATGIAAPKAPADSRIAAMFALTTFTLDKEHAALRVLEVRVRYHDGIALWLNGLEIARRSLDDTRTRALAAHPHGAEWETFYVPAAPGLLRLGENVLAIEAHPSARRDAPEVAVDIVGRRDLGILRGPIVADVGPTNATINVETDPDLDATLDWGTGDTLDQTVHSVPGRMHAFTLTGLPANAKFSYRVRAGVSQSQIYKLRTAPAAGDVIRIGVYGDVRGGHDIHRRLIDAMLGEGFDLVTVTGDLVLRGADEGDWQRFFTVTRDLLAQVRYVPAIGNHDVGWNRADPDVFALPPAPAGRPDRTYWYSLDLADIHLVFLDSNAYGRIEQEQWLDEDLKQARERRVRAIIALTHDGPFSRGDHLGNTTARDRYVPILVKHHVDLLLAGHDHIYQRGEKSGIRYVVSGGGGAGLYAISCGVDGKRACPDDGMQKVLSEHHYIALTIEPDRLEMCPRRADGRLLEKCTRYSLWHP